MPDHDEYYYIALNPGGKDPYQSFGGWPIDPDHPHVYTYDETQDIDWNNWAVCGHKTGRLLVIDVDAYKMDEATEAKLDNDWNGFIPRTRIVTTQSGGVHVYFIYDGTPDDWNFKTLEHVDIKGDIGRGYAAAPFSPGYELAQDKPPAVITEEEAEALPVVTGRKPGVITEFSIDHIPHVAPPCVWGAADLYEKTGDPVALKYMKMWLNRYDPMLGTNTDIYRFQVEDEDSVDISVYDVLEPAQYPEGERVAHPFHDSESGANFMVDPGAETWRCWRHDVTGNALHLVGIKFGAFDCGAWNDRRITKSEWRHVFRAIKTHDIVDLGTGGGLTCEAVEDMGFCPRDCGKPYPTH